MFTRPALIILTAVFFLFEVDTIHAASFTFNRQNFTIQKSLNFSFLRSLFQFRRVPKTASSGPTTSATTVPIPTPASYSPTSTPSATPTIANASIPNSIRSYILGEINVYRKREGLQVALIDPYTCNFAKRRVQEVAQTFDHSGFTSRRDSNTLPYPSYSEITENLARASSYRQVADLWISSTPHAENLRKDTPFACVEGYGNYYVYEGWKP